ncbi:hypothetical protein MUK72_19285 (plasmid) [Halococcus dombrowskii]|uniref:Uncharacterized protein n=1 Tax=Halococcus dombrowskii TaxID=179637 RepID=A0AAV3SI61_HALDO|nr:hypothetical protein [Halococcus dombrowskii]UOO97296.1 hypothetical protein MUK72_19285 [Halococcus dombrowskii]
MFDSDSESFADRERDRDQVLNAETRRALGHAARLIGVAVIGALTVIVALALAAATAILSAPWQLYVAVTAIIAIVLPVAVPYTMLRVYGLAHRDVVYVAKRAYREITVEIIALSGTSPASVAFIGSTDTDTDDAADSGSHNPVEDGSDDATPGFESEESAAESSIAHETADTTEPEP